MMENKNIIEVPIEKDLKYSYLDYAMSVIIGRALPDVRDGLKPVQRRILFVMKELGNTYNKPFKKSARIVGEVLGKYHPHGDSAIYEALVRMAQSFVMRYALIEGQGNFGSIDGDNPAAMRYTEVRMSRISEEMLEDLEKETVSFIKNFDGSLEEPTVLPTKIPNLLINGSEGIAVGIATKIPPHNLNEIVDALIVIIDGKENEVFNIVKGPDFPTGGIIVGKKGIEEAYKTGKGAIIVRARAKVDNEKKQIIINEIPYGMKKSELIEKIVNNVKEGKIEGIVDVLDRSNKEGIEVIIKVKRDYDVNVVLNQLYKYRCLQDTYGINCVAIVNKEPKTLTLLDLLKNFIEFRKEIVKKRSEFEKNEAEKKAHILEGIVVALKNVDEVVRIVKNSGSSEEAKNTLQKTFLLTERQADAIVEMKIRTLTAMEREKVEKELEELKSKIKWLSEVLSDERKILEIIKKEFLEIKEKYGDERRTEIIEAAEIEEDKLIFNEKVVIMLSKRNYLKKVSLDEFRLQNRGGKGIIGTQLKEEDLIEHILIADNKSYLLGFTNKGKVYWLKVYEIEKTGRYGIGKAITNILQLEENEKITSLISISEFKEDKYLLMLTKKGIVKRVKLSEFSNPRKGGITAITLREGDSLVDVKETSGNESFIIATKNGMAIRINESEVREIGRSGQGVIGIKLDDDDEAVSLSLCRKEYVLTITENGFGKRTLCSEFKEQSRGGQGVINLKTNEKSGKVIGVVNVGDNEEIIVISNSAQTLRTKVNQIRIVGRGAIGVKIINLKDKEKLVNFSVIE